MMPVVQVTAVLHALQYAILRAKEAAKQHAAAVPAAVREAVLLLVTDALQRVPAVTVVSDVRAAVRQAVWDVRVADRLVGPAVTAVPDAEGAVLMAVRDAPAAAAVPMDVIRGAADTVIRLAPEPV